MDFALFKTTHRTAPALFLIGMPAAAAIVAVVFARRPVRRQA